MFGLRGGVGLWDLWHLASREDDVLMFCLAWEGVMGYDLLSLLGVRESDGDTKVCNIYIKLRPAVESLSNQETIYSSELASHMPENINK